MRMAYLWSESHPAPVCIYPDKWKILFLALSNINTPTIKTSLSSDQVDNIRYRSNLFEDFGRKDK